jgi:toxin FitB
VIVLDTNVLSALMRPAPDERVVAWLDSQPAESIWTTSVTLFEVHFGLATLAKGKKRRALESVFEAMLAEDLQGRVLPFDEQAATEAAAIAASLRLAGRGTDIRDTMIAGIVAARRGVLATRNTRHFAGTGVRLVDPWSDPSSIH